VCVSVCLSVCGGCSCGRVCVYVGEREGVFVSVCGGYSCRRVRVCVGERECVWVCCVQLQCIAPGVYFV